MNVLHDWKRKITRNVGYKLGVSGLTLLLVGAVAFFSLPCPFMKWLHVPCMGCGMTRAWLSVLRLDFADAFGYHPMFWTVPFMVLCFWLDWEPFTKKWMNTALYCLELIGFLVCWLFRIF